MFKIPMIKIKSAFNDPQRKRLPLITMQSFMMSL